MSRLAPSVSSEQFQPLSLCGNSEENIPDTFICGNSQSWPKIQLPFYCKFSNVNLSNAASVSYKVLNVCPIYIDDNDIKLDKNTPSTYGDYANDSSLGVTLPQDGNGTIDTSKVHITNEYISISLPFSLSYLVLCHEYNQSTYKLYTTDLTDATDTIESNTTRTYNFGFIGTTPIKISGNGIAKFMGNNSDYTPKDEDDNPVEITLPDEVEFGNKSLFQFTQTYGKGTFSAGNYTNTIPSGKIVTFTGGFTLGKGHTLIVSGTLIG